MLQLLLHQGGEHDDAAKQRLEQLWQEVAPQVRRDVRVAIEDTRCSNTRAPLVEERAVVRAEPSVGGESVLVDEVRHEAIEG